MTLPDADERRQIAINLTPWLVGTIRAITVSGVMAICGVLWTAYGTLADHTNTMKQLIQGQEEAKRKIESMEVQLLDRVQKDEERYDSRYAGIQTDVSSMQRDLAVLRQRQTDDIEHIDMPPRRPANPLGKGQ